MIILVTGVAGFIGFHATQTLLAEGYEVVGIDNLNDYYDVSLKNARLSLLKSHEKFAFHQLDLAVAGGLEAVLGDIPVTHILHLAAQAGVRYSLDNPHAYISSNVMGHLNILEYGRHLKSLKHLVYASSSSIYGERDAGSFSEQDIVRSPASLYAATKISGEMLSESYARLYGIPQIGLRFFTVYGPWGRPDMAYFIFTKKILAGEPITLFAPDVMKRDFTYVDDIMSVLPRILRSPSKADARHEIYNLGNSRPNRLIRLVEAVETACGRTATKIIEGQQKGDVASTYANIEKATQDFGFNPTTSLEDGISKFVEWYRDFYKI